MEVKTFGSLIAPAVAAAMALTSCESVNEPGDVHPSSVICRLESGRTTQYLRIYRTAEADIPRSGAFEFSPSQDPYVNFLLDQADVRVWDAHGAEHQFLFRIDSTYLFQSDSVKYYSVQKKFESVDSVAVVPGMTLRLSASASGGRISGHTVVPGDFSLLYPGEEDDLSAAAVSAGVNLVWSRSTSASGYLVTVSNTAWHTLPWGEIRSYPREYHTESSDTICRIQPTFYVAPSDTIEVAIVAYDENYYNHRHRGLPESGLNGAYGYFASGVRKTRTLVLK